ncbi:MAG: hypothetical protein RLZZ461_673, partial [Planctomycetota bacterium]
MPPTEPHAWRRTFVGRTEELERLMQAFEAVSPASFDPAVDGPGQGATFVVIEGPSGLGKSRLVQEFYRRVADSSPEAIQTLDPDDYWPDAFGDPDLVGKLVNPIFEPGVRRKAAPPFLWWGVRWPPPVSEDSTGIEIALTKESHIDSLAVHWDACKRRIEAAIEAAKVAAKIARSFVLPEVFSSTLRDILEGMSTVEDGVDAGKGVRKTVQDWRLRHQGRDVGESLKAREGHRLRSLEKVLRAILEPTGLGWLRDAATPLIMWLDDAQWMTEEEASFLGRLVQIGRDRRWPWLVVATAWPPDRTGSTAEQPFHALVKRLAGPEVGSRDTADRNSDPECFVRLTLSDDRLAIDLRPVICAALPGATPPQVEAIAEKAPGHPLLLRLILEDILSSPVNFTEAGPEGPVAEECIAALSQMSAGVAWKTFVRKKLDRLDREVREVLEIGSVQGTEFAREVTLRAAESRGIDRDTSQRALADSAATLAIVDAADNDAELQFRQPFYREYLHDELRDQDRRTITELVRRMIIEEIESAESEGRALSPLILELARTHLRLENSDTVGSKEGRARVLAVLALLQRMGAEGRQSQSLALARELVMMDERRDGGIPLALLGPRQLQHTLAVLDAHAPDIFVGFAKRVRPRLRNAAPEDAPEATQALDFIVERLGRRVDRLGSMASIRGAEASLLDEDPLAARLQLAENPENHRGPEHWILNDLARLRSRLVRSASGGNPYRLCKIPGTSDVVVIFDNTLEIIDRTGRTPPQSIDSCLPPPLHFGMRLSISSPVDEGQSWLLAVGCGADATEDSDGNRSVPRVLLGSLSRDQATGTYRCKEIASFTSVVWGETCFTPDHRLLMASRHGALEIRSAPDWDSVEIIPCPAGPPHAMTMLDHSTVAMATSGATGLLDLTTGTWRDLGGPSLQRPTSIVRGSNNQILVAGDRSVHSVDIRQTKEVWSHIGNAAIWDVAISPGDARSIAVGHDSMIRLLDGEGQEIGHSGDADGITWSVHWDAEGIVCSHEGGGVLSFSPDAIEAAFSSEATERPDISGRTLAVTRSAELLRLADHTIEFRTFSGPSRRIKPRWPDDGRWILPTQESDETWPGPIEWNETTREVVIHASESGPRETCDVPQSVVAWWPIPGMRRAAGFDTAGAPIQVEWDDRGNCTTRAFEIEGTVLRRDFTQCLTDLAGRPVFGR